MSPASHHHFVVWIAIALVVACAVGVFIALRKRNKKQAYVQDEDITGLIAERLSTGQFSRAPSSFRRKAVGADGLPEQKKQGNG
jgi:hypothetical protein